MLGLINFTLSHFWPVDLKIDDPKIEQLFLATGAINSAVWCRAGNATTPRNHTTAMSTETIILSRKRAAAMSPKEMYRALKRERHTPYPTVTTALDAGLDLLNPVLDPDHITPLFVSFKQTVDDARISQTATWELACLYRKFAFDYDSLLAAEGRYEDESDADAEETANTLEASIAN